MVLSGCGFQPMLATSSSQKQSFILAVKGDGYPAYIFRREMEKQLALVPKLNEEVYRVDISVSGSKAAASNAVDATVSRFQSTYTAAYTVNSSTGKKSKKTSSVKTSYPVIPRDEFISQNADTAASTRAAISLAQDVAREIIRDIKKLKETIGDSQDRANTIALN